MTISLQRSPSIAQISAGGKWLFNAYIMGAYSESGRCDADALIRADEAKHLRIDVLRDLSGDRMADALRRAFLMNMPADASPNLKAQINTFLSHFRQDLVKGGRLELTYLPGVGTRLERNGKQAGDVTTGKAFAELVWSLLFQLCDLLPRPQVPDPVLLSEVTRRSSTSGQGTPKA